MYASIRVFSGTIFPAQGYNQARYFPNKDTVKGLYVLVHEKSGQRKPVYWHILHIEI